MPSHSRRVADQLEAWLGNSWKENGSEGNLHSWGGDWPNLNMGLQSKGLSIEKQHLLLLALPWTLPLLGPWALRVAWLVKWRTRAAHASREQKRVNSVSLSTPVPC